MQKTMKVVNQSFVSILLITCFFLSLAFVEAKVLFYEDFNDGKIDKKHELKNHPR